MLGHYLMAAYCFFFVWASSYRIAIINPNCYGTHDSGSTSFDVDSDCICKHSKMHIGDKDLSIQCEKCSSRVHQKYNKLPKETMAQMSRDVSGFAIIVEGR